MNKDMHVVVLMGGWSAERDVSLTSGKGVVEALKGRGWTNVTPLDMDRNVARVLEELRPDVVFNALHGTPGEDVRRRVREHSGTELEWEIQRVGVYAGSAE